MYVLGCPRKSLNRKELAFVNPTCYDTDAPGIIPEQLRGANEMLRINLINPRWYKWAFIGMTRCVPFVDALRDMVAQQDRSKT